MLPQQDRINNYTLIGLLLIISALFFYLVQDYVLAAFYAAILSGGSRKLYIWFLKKTKEKTSLSALFTVLIVIIALLIPLAGLIILLVEEAIGTGEAMTNWLNSYGSADEGLSGIVKSIPLVDQVFPDSSELDIKVHEVVNKLSDWVVNSLSHVASGSAHFILKSIVCLFLFYYFLVDGLRIWKHVLAMIPMQSKDKQVLAGRFKQVITATLKGTGVIALVQGTIGGIAMAMAGIPNTIFWGFMIGVFSMIPSVGTTIVWLPAGIMLIASGNPVAGYSLLAFCFLILGNLDNVIRPWLVGKETQLSDFLVFLSTLGGIGVFGISGIILGPLVAALFVSIWHTYENNFSNVLQKMNEVSTPAQPPDSNKEE